MLFIEVCYWEVVVGNFWGASNGCAFLLMKAIGRTAAGFYGNGTSSSKHHGNQKVGPGEMSFLSIFFGASKISTSNSDAGQIIATSPPREFPQTVVKSKGIPPK